MSLLHVNRTLYSSPPHPLLPILTPHPLSYTPGKECEELPVIGSFCLRKDSGIATRQTLQLAGKMYVKGWFDVQNNNILERDYYFLSKMDLGDVDKREV